MARELSASNIGKVIKVLRAKRLSSSELQKETGISERTLRRILNDYLLFWKLAAKDDAGNWAWYETTRAFDTTAEKELTLEHSKKLIPGIDLLADSLANPEMYTGDAIGLAQQDAYALKRAAEDHIRTGYPALFSNIENLHDLNLQRKELYEELTGENSNYYHDILKEIDLFPKKLEIGIPKKNLSKVKELMKKISADQLALNSKLEEQWKTVYVEITEGTLFLERKINHGTPLEGSCQLCPKIKIKQTS